jgi:predicted nuclease with TOPRIM domain
MKKENSKLEGQLHERETQYQSLEKKFEETLDRAVAAEEISKVSNVCEVKTSSKSI